jgi:SsrA-binding protein
MTARTRTRSASTAKVDEGERNICLNKRARYDYELGERFEAGLVLAGTEVKSLRDGGADLRDAFAAIRGGELYLVNAQIAAYANASHFNHEPRRDRKLLLHRREIAKLTGQLKLKGLTVVPVRMYFKRGRAKVELALAKGKKQYDRRADTAEREARRELDRAMRIRR